MPSRFYVIFIIPILIYLSGCSPCSNDGGKVWCSVGGVNIEFNGFDSTELSTIYLLQYPKGANFVSNTVDTSIFVRCSDTCCFNFCYYKDTAYLTGYPVISEYDYEIILPGWNTVKISNIALQKTWACRDDPMVLFGVLGCNVTSYELNGKITTPVNQSLQISK